MENSDATELERAFLGAIISNETLFQNIRGYISHDDFFDQKNALVFQAISSIFDQGFAEIELRLIVKELKTQGHLNKIGGENYLAQLINEQGLASNANKYMQEISANSALRNVKKKINKLNNDLASSKMSADDALEKVEMEILNNTRGSSIKEFISAEAGIKNAIDGIEKRATGDFGSGISVELPSIDEITLGFQKGDLIILAARPAMGKTALALNMAINAAMHNKVAFFSLEMPSVQLFNRILSSQANVDGNKIRDPSRLTAIDHAKLHSVRPKIEKYNLFVDDTAGIKLSELVWKAKRLHRNNGLDMIVIDYLQLIVVASITSDNRQNEVSTISRTLKKLARDLDIPVIALSQLSRKVEMRENKRPMMSDIRESGAIEQDADVIAFVYRESYYNKDKKIENGKHEATEVIIAKHRNGSTGTVSLAFKPSTGLFTELKLRNNKYV